MLTDTFLKIFRNIDKYDPDYEFKPWIRKICINSCLSYNKKYFKHQKTISLDLINDFENNENESIAEYFSAEECLSFLTNLTPQYRTVFNLYVFEDMKHHEIAQELNISVGTSKSNLSRAKNQLIEAMKTKKPALFNQKKVFNG